MFEAFLRYVNPVAGGGCRRSFRGRDFKILEQLLQFPKVLRPTLRSHVIEGQDISPTLELSVDTHGH